MGNMTLAVPDDIQQEMKHFSDIRWSEVARKAIVEKLKTLKLTERLAKKRPHDESYDEMIERVESAWDNRGEGDNS